MLTDQKTTVEELKQIMKKFKADRNWDQYNTPKNLSMAIAIEAGELMEHFMWIEDSKAAEALLEKKRDEIEAEVADILAYMLSLCAGYNIDLSRAFERKMQVNAEKYPIEKAKGRHDKYNQL